MCSSDLRRGRDVFAGNDRGVADGKHARIPCDHDARADADEIGRASCRERV